jgi:sec-independent protein translocase protein TatA
MLYPALMGLQEWGPIIIVLLLLFGAKKLPELARSMGSSVNEFKKGMAEGMKPEDKTDERPNPSNDKNNKEP